MRLISFAAAASLTLALLLGAALAATTISGAGATFPDLIYAKWAHAYKNETGIELIYRSIGSGGGIKQIEAKTVTFGATDKPLGEKELLDDGLVQFPMVMGGIVPVVNVEGVKGGELVLDGATLAKIFLGEISKWDDAAIKTLNPTAKLPAQAMEIVHRSDGSGTTFNFTNYLSKVREQWKSKVGSEASVEWPVGVGAKGNKGVASEVADTEGSIGYVDYAYAKQQKLTYANMINKDGKTVAPELKSFQAAAANADWKATPGFGVILTDQRGEASWPITAATFILMHKGPADLDASREALAIFDWAYRKGDGMAEDLDYIPLPGSVVDLVHEAWRSITDSAGKPLFAMK
jgi:phosphate transport system substrate-binding protein